MKDSRTFKPTLRAGAWSLVMALGLTAHAATITQTNDNTTANGGESWLTTNDWDGVVNTPGNDYVNNTAIFTTRTPPSSVAPSPTFLGDSLTITNGAKLKIKHSGICTINDLRIWAGCSLANGGVGAGSSMAGNLALKGTGSVTFDVESTSRAQIIDMLVTVDPTISTIVITSSGTFNTSSGFTFNNVANTFAGTWDVQKGYLKGTGFGSGSFAVGASGILNFDSDFYGNASALSVLVGGVVVLDQNITVDTLTVWGTQLNAGTYTGAELKAALYGASFAGSTDAATLIVLSGPSLVTGDTIHQTADMPIDADWNTPSYWDNGLAPASTNDYINDNYNPTNVNEVAWSTRTPASGSGTFGGKSLTITNGAALNVKGAGPWTINTLNVWAGSKINNGGPAAAEISGGLNLKGTGSVVLDAGVPGRKTTISSLLTADETLTNISVLISQTAPTNSVQAMSAGFIVNGPINEFNGTWVVEEGLLKGTGFGTGSFRVTDMGVLDFDANYINPAASLSIEANPTNAAMNGLLLLDKNVQVGSATLAGASLPEGLYTGAALKAHPVYGAVISSSTDDTAILAVGTAVALPVYQITTGSSAVTWDTATSWDNGLAPSSLYDYVNNTSGWTTRNPNGASTFAGKSLTLSNGAQLKLQYNSAATISNLTLYAGCQIRTVNNTTLNGDLTLAGTGGIVCDFENITRSMTVNALVTAASTITNITITASQTNVSGNVSGFIFTNPANTFTGTWIVEEGYLKGAGLGQGSFLIKASGFLDPDASYNNPNAMLTIEQNPTNSAVGGQILLDQNMTVGLATIWGTRLPIGVYNAETLASNPVYGGAFAAGSTGTLTVTKVPEVPEIGTLAYGVTGGNVVLGWTGSETATYILQGKTDLVNGTWSNLQQVAGINGAMSLTNATTAPIQFFRLVGENNVK